MSKFFGLTAPKNLKEEPFCAVFQKISSSEKLYGYELGGGVVARFTVEKCLSYSAEKFRI